MFKTVMIFAISIALFGCNSVHKLASNKSSEDSPKTVYNWDGVYRGVFPCTNCDGIQTTLILSRSLNYTLKSVYLGKAKEVIEKGTFVWNESGNKITLTSNESNKKSVYLIEKDAVTKLNNKNKIITQDFELTKAAYAIYERYWKLVSLRGEDVKMAGEVKSKKEPHIIFKNDQNKIFGSGGCNNMFGKFKLLRNSHIQISQLASTMMACPNLDFEKNFFKTLEAANSYSVVSDTLTMYDKEKNIIAVFRAYVM